MTKKFATPAGTAEYFKNHQVNQTKIRKIGDLTVSGLAMGSYLGDCSSEVDGLYEESFLQGLQSGINFIDTAINYRCQRSEKNIGYAIKKVSSLGVDRQQIFVSTKGGFLPADEDPESFQSYVLKCFINTGIISPDDIVANCHCMTPKYLQSQIDLSLSNLKLDAIDLYYLHNPEMQLPVVGEKAFYENLSRVFACFEENVAAGKIKSYGLATWDGFRQGFGSEKRLDLEKVLSSARDVAGEAHHFKAVQLPYNLAMLEAVAIKSQKIGDEEFPFIPAAVHHGISVMVSAPLMQSNLLQLPQELYDRMPGEGSKMQKCLSFVSSAPGVVSAMVGMKSRSHLEENLQVLHQENWEVTDLQAIAQLLVRSVG